MDLWTLIQENMAPTIVLACLAIGYVLKRLAWVPDKFIPLIMFCLGTVFSFIINGFSFQSFLVGCISGVGSTGFHQLFKQLIEKKGDDTGDTK